MTNVNKLIDKAKELSSSATDMALAEKLHVGRSTVSNYRSGHAYPDAVVCARISEITGEPLAKVLGIVGEARAISDAEKKVWRRLANAAVLIMCTLPIALVFAGSGAWTSGNLYIMSGSMCCFWALSITFLNRNQLSSPDVGRT